MSTHNPCRGVTQDLLDKIAALEMGLFKERKYSKGARDRFEGLNDRITELQSQLSIRDRQIEVAREALRKILNRAMDDHYHSSDGGDECVAVQAIVMIATWN